MARGIQEGAGDMSKKQLYEKCPLCGNFREVRQTLYVGIDCKCSGRIFWDAHKKYCPKINQYTDYGCSLWERK